MLGAIKKLTILSVLTFLFSLPALSRAANINAQSCSQADVQAAINQAQDGDTVMIPNGSCSWTTGISTTKQIWIRAQNYTPTPGGNTTRNVTITNNSNMPLFSFTTGNSFHVGLSGIRFNEGSGTGSHVTVNGSGSKVALISDLYLEVKSRYWPVEQGMKIYSQGGVIWNSRFVSTAPLTDAGGGIFVQSPRAWNTASTMGALDANGTVNVYIENSSFLNMSQSPDIDDNGRFVIRYSTLDGTWGLIHGFSGLWGGRHAEYYDNTFSVTSDERAIAARYFWLRAGTIVFTDNVVNNASNPSLYGSPVLLDIGDIYGLGPYPVPRQPGWGHDGTTDVIDPIYIWNNTGARAYAYGISNGWDSNVQLNRDLFVNNGPKPGYAKYTYPHPLRAVIEGPPPPPDTQAPTTPSNLTAQAVSSSQINLSWTASTDNVGVTGYRMERCQGSGCSNFSQIATPSTNSYNDTGLSASTAYSYRVRAIDAVGNLSAYSSIASATTQAPPPPGSAVFFDSSANSPDLSNQTSSSWNHTTSGSNRYLVVGLAGWDESSSLANVNVTYNGVVMAKLGGTQNAGQNQAVLWGLSNPALGTHTVSISNIPSSFAELGGGSVSLTDVHQTVSTGTLVSETGGDASVTITLSSGDLGIDILYSGAGTQEPVIGTGGTKRVNTNLASQTDKWLMMGTEGGTGSIAMSWTDAGGADFAQAAIPVKFAGSVPPDTTPPSAPAGLTVQ